VLEYGNAPERKRQAQERTARLEAQRELLQSRAGMVRQARDGKQQELAGRQHTLTERPEYGNVSKLEARLRQLAAANHAAAEAIRARESEHNYRGLAQTVAALAGELNAGVIKATAASAM